MQSPSVATSKMRSGLGGYLNHWHEWQIRRTAHCTLTCSSRERPISKIGSVRERRGRRQGAVALGWNPQASRSPAFSPTNAPRSMRHQRRKLSPNQVLASRLGGVLTSGYPCADQSGICARVPVWAAHTVQRCPRLVENSPGRIAGVCHLAHKGCTAQPWEETARCIQPHGRHVAFIARKCGGAARIILQQRKRMIKQQTSKSDPSSSRNQSKVDKFHATRGRDFTDEARADHFTSPLKQQPQTRVKYACCKVSIQDVPCRPHLCESWTVKRVDVRFRKQRFEQVAPLSIPRTDANLRVGRG